MPTLRYYPDGRVGALGEPPTLLLDRGLSWLSLPEPPILPVAERLGSPPNSSGTEWNVCMTWELLVYHRLLGQFGKLYAASVLIVVAVWKGHCRA